MDINRNDSDEFFGASDDGGAIGQPDEGGQDNTGEYGRLRRCKYSGSVCRAGGTKPLFVFKYST